MIRHLRVMLWCKVLIWLIYQTQFAEYLLLDCLFQHKLLLVLNLPVVDHLGFFGYLLFWRKILETFSRLLLVTFSKFWQLRKKTTQKSASKDFIKTFPTSFLRISLQHFSIRPYLNVKIIIAYFLANLFNVLHIILHKIYRQQRLF